MTTVPTYAALNLFEPPTAHRDLFQAALDRCAARIAALVPRFGLRNPRVSRPGTRRYAFCDADEWVASFWSGQLWLAHSLTGELALRESARMRRAYFQRVLDTPEWHDHDLGFLFSLTAVADHRLTGDAAARAMGLRAAEALAARWRQPIPALVCWNPSPRDTPELAARKAGTLIIDSLENVPLLLWAARETGNAAFGRIAGLHLETCRARLIRDDGSAFHCFEFEPATGRPVGGFSHQGFADDSAWARGQGWGVHGFALAYLNTGETIWRDTAARMADFVEDNLPEDGVPLWDYRLPEGEARSLDSSAGAITAAGLYALARCFGDDGPEARRYTALADRMLAGLVQHCDLTGDPDAEGLLGEGAAHVALGLRDVMLPYGDYYYVEALMRALGHDSFFW